MKKELIENPSPNLDGNPDLGEISKRYLLSSIRAIMIEKIDFFIRQLFYIPAPQICHITAFFRRHQFFNIQFCVHGRRWRNPEFKQF